MAMFEPDDNSLSNNSSLRVSNLEYPHNPSIYDSYEAGVFPVNIRPLQNQVAGHAYEDGNRTVGMLKHSDGYVLKPVNRPGFPIQGENEITFYEKMLNVKDPLLVKLKSFIPEYYGTSVLDLQGNLNSVTFLLLKDITNGFKEPCVMDIKVGKQTWEPGASLEKQQSEQKKYTECKKQLSFCIPGFQTYDIKTKQFQKFGKDYGKQLDVNGVYNAFRIFFNAEYGIGEYLITPMLHRLREILNWWKKQTFFHIYSSSILLAYDATIVRTNISNENDRIGTLVHNHMNKQRNLLDNSSAADIKTNLDSWLCVYLIDFAHVVPADNSLDFNYINGLVSLIKVFENLLEEFRLKRIEKEVVKS